MKICLRLIILLVLLLVRFGAAEIYEDNFNDKYTIGNTLKQIEDFGSNLKLQAELNSELEQGLLKINAEDKSPLDTEKRNIYNMPTSLMDPTISDQQQEYSDDFRNPYVSSQNNNNNKYIMDLNNIASGGHNMRLRSRSELKKVRSDHFDCGSDEIRNFVGTNLFDCLRKKCFTLEDVALLAARKDFEMLIPKDLPLDYLTDDMVKILMRYFYRGNKLVQCSLKDEMAKHLVERAFYDMLGGYLRYYVIPLTQYSFYAGKACLNTVESVIQLYDQCRSFLNTNGNGWHPPLTNIKGVVQTCNLEPLHISQEECGNGEETSACVQLMLASDDSDVEDNEMIVCLPKIEMEDCHGRLSNIWLPLKKKHTYDLRSPKSANILLKFYETVAKCYRFQRLPQTTFDKKFYLWMLENLQMHFCDEQFYPGLGGILRVYENLRRGRKPILFENEIAIDEMSSRVDDGDNVADVEDNEDTGSNSIDGDLNLSEESNEDTDEKVTKKKRNQFNVMIDEMANRDLIDVPRSPGSAEEELCTAPPIKVKCERKSKKKKKKRPKCKPGHNKNNHNSATSYHEPKIESDRTGSGFWATIKGFWPADFIESIKSGFTKYFPHILILLFLLFLLLLLYCLFGSWFRKRRKGAHPDTPTKSAHGHDKKEAHKTAPGKKRKKTWYGWCGCFKGKGHEEDDEEIHVRPESKSVLSTKTHKPLTHASSSSLLCEPTKTCIPFLTCDNDGAASDGGVKKGKKTKQKMVTINEKKNTVSPSKSRFKRKSKTESSKLNKTDGSQSGSWETMTSMLPCSGKDSLEERQARGETSSFEYTTSDDEVCKKKASTASKLSPRRLLKMLSRKTDKDEEYCKWKRYGIQPSTMPQDPSSTSSFSNLSAPHRERQSRVGLEPSCYPADTSNTKSTENSPKSAPKSSTSASPKKTQSTNKLKFDWKRKSKQVRTPNQAAV